MAKLLLIIIVLPFIALVGALIYNMYERIKEIKEDNKDDISKYWSYHGKGSRNFIIVKGSIVWSKNVGKDILSGLKTLVGGEIVSYTEMMNEARSKATKRMVKEAEALGADGILNIRYATSNIMQGAAEVIAYGTAVKFK